MDDKEKRQLLKDEYLHLQSVIEDFDSKSLTIKTWSISFSFAAIGAAFATDAPIILLIAALSALTFWIIEAQWKGFQYAHYDRSGKIEDFFKGNIQDITPMQIGTSWSENWHMQRFQKLFEMFFWPHVALPHVLVFALGITVYVLVLVGIFPI